MTTYGTPPTLLGQFDLPFVEYTHRMYLPIVIEEGEEAQVSVPYDLEFAMPVITAALDHEADMAEANPDYPAWQYVYVTARRGYATPGNPLNRPGWHSDGFGTHDVNYVWTDRYPTLFAVGKFEGISDDHLLSAQQFEEQIETAQRDIQKGYHPEVNVQTYPDRELMRLDPSVIHAAPEIPAPGGERSFLKISFSTNRYDLMGNAHNYGLRYDWPMYERAVTRNDPATAGRDFGHTRMGGSDNG